MRLIRMVALSSENSSVTGYWFSVSGRVVISFMTTM